MSMENTEKQQPVRFALVHLMKAYDIAHFAQLSVAVGNIEAFLVGNTLDFSHPKVLRKVLSWNIQQEAVSKIPNGKFANLNEIKQLGYRLVGTSPSDGQDPYYYQWSPADVITIGGANGLSQNYFSQLDDLLTIPTAPEVSFLTTTTVIPMLYAMIMYQRNGGNDAI